ncbi:MAG: ribosome biogenesis factor YjgA [Methylococcaceae bacterium]
MSEEYEYDEDDVEYYAVRPNKTQLKKDIAVLFALGEEMSELSGTQLKTLKLPENIYKAVAEVAGMPLKGARKRLLKFIAGQLHKIDVEPIQEKLARIKNKSAHAVREHHIVERWRDRLIAEGYDALTELLDKHPDADRQQLRQLVRNAQKEAEAAKPPKSSRLLYRYLKYLFKGEDGPESDDEQTIESDDHEKVSHLSK